MARAEVTSPLAGVRYDAARGELATHRFVPSAADSPIREYARAYWRLGETERVQARSALDEGDSYTLNAFSTRAVLMWLRDGSAQHLRAGLAALAAINEAAVDYRDISGWLLSWGLAESGLDVPAEMEQAAERSGGVVARELRARTERWATNLSECAYVQAEHLGQPVLIRRQSWAPWSPTVDLASAAYAVEDLIAADVYRPVRFKVDTMPARLFDGTRGDTRDALAGIRASVFISARLRPEAYRNWKHQELWVSVAEAETPADAAALAAGFRSPDDRVFGVTRRGLCALIFQGSSWSRAKPYEKTGGLRRFEQHLLQFLDRYATR